MSNLLAGRYELIEKIGEGGMAIVYKAKCRLLNRYVAIKILRPEFTRDAQFVENFKRESQAAAGLQHPNIVSVYDVGKEGNIHYIVMELIDGRPLSDIIEEKGPLDYKTAIEIAKQVASALSLAHRNNIIHRDVKPHNIMITKDGIAKLGDFGIAKAVSDSTMVAETSKIIGSVHYFSPEQARGAYVDERTDIYSLGIVLYEMLTGKVPFDGDNPVQVALMHINDDIVPPSQLVSGIPPALEKLVMKATDKYQSNRYKSADEMLQELDNIEFVTKMVGNSVFAASDIKDYPGRDNTAEEELAQLDIGSKKSKGGKQKNKNSKKKKNDGSGKSRKIVIGAIAGVIAVIAIIAGVFLASGFGGGGITVPNVKGMEYEEAKAVLEEAKLNIRNGGEVPSDKYEAGLIATQTPDSHEKVEKGDTIVVMISSGKQLVRVPYLDGIFDEGEISQLLASMGLELGSVREEESYEEKGTIIGQSPGRNEEVEPGTRVDIVISKGTDKVSLPSVTGMTEEAAMNKLSDFNVNVEYVESESYGKGIVISQSPNADEKLEPGADVTITVSLGVPDIPVEPEPEEPEEETPDAGEEQAE